MKNTFSKLRNEKRLIQEKLNDSLKALELKDNEIFQLNQKLEVMKKFNDITYNKLEVETDKVKTLLKILRRLKSIRNEYYDLWVKQVGKQSDNETKLKIIIGVIVMVFTSILMIKGIIR